ncbi:hypothetical protein [Holdemanella biformis]
MIYLKNRVVRCKCLHLTFKIYTGRNGAKIYKIHFNDLAAVAPYPPEKGTVCNVDGQEITLIEDIAQKHKFTLKDIPGATYY